MRVLTAEEWNRTHQDYKGVDPQGQAFVLVLDKVSGATVAEPVTVLSPKVVGEASGNMFRRRIRR